MFTARKPVHAFIRTGQFVHDAIVINDLDPLQTMLVSDFKVVGIVRRCDFQRSGTEFHVHITVKDNGDGFFEDREQHPGVFQMTVTVVFGINRHGRIPQQGFRSCCGDGEMACSIF